MMHLPSHPRIQTPRRHRTALFATLALLGSVYAGFGCSDSGPGADAVDSGGSSGAAGTSNGAAGSDLGAGAGTGAAGATDGLGGDGNSGGAAGTAGQSNTSGAATAGSGTAGDATTLPDDPNEVLAEPPPTVLVPSARVARLSRQQWSNTVRALLKIDDIADIEDDVSGDALIGFDSEADALYVTEQLRRQLADASALLAERVVGDAAALSRLEAADAPQDLQGRAEAFVTTFGLRAFRRPLTAEEVAAHLELFQQGPELYPELQEFEAGAQLVIQAFLQSPHFLYRTELGVAEGGATSVRLNDYEVASKLAFALTNTMPTDELLVAAGAGELQERESIRAHAQALIEKAQGVSAGVSNFNAQVFRLGAYKTITRDPEDFPMFSLEAPEAMRTEVLMFLEWIFRESGGVADYYTSPVGFVNSALAPLYELEGDFSSDVFTQVEHDPSQRSGILTQAGFLSAYISGKEPDIIHRGVFIATRLLCLDLLPPTDTIPPLPEIGPDMTNRERVETTTGKGTCGEGCHTRLINPLGYAFENYDAVGTYRTTDQGKPVDAADVYRLDGGEISFSNGVELSHLLAESKQAHSCYVENMMSYLHGRVLDIEDGPLVDYYARLSRADEISVRDLTLDIVTSEEFLTRLP